MGGRLQARPGSQHSSRTSAGKFTGEVTLKSVRLITETARVPETATVLLGGGVNFADLPEYAQIEFQVVTDNVFNKDIQTYSSNLLMFQYLPLKLRLFG